MFEGQKPKVAERLRRAGEKLKHWYDNSTDLLDFELLPGTMVMRKQQCQGKLLSLAEGSFEFIQYGNCEKTTAVL